MKISAFCSQRKKVDGHDDDDTESAQSSCALLFLDICVRFRANSNIMSFCRLNLVFNSCIGRPYNIVSADYTSVGRVAHSKPNNN